MQYLLRLPKAKVWYYMLCSLPLFLPRGPNNSLCSGLLMLLTCQCKIQEACPAWSRTAASCLNSFLLGCRVRHFDCKMDSALPTHSVLAEKLNNIFFLLLFIPGVCLYSTDSPVHSCSTSLIEAMFCNILFTLPTLISFIIIEISLGERPMQQNVYCKWSRIWMEKTGVQRCELVAIKYTILNSNSGAATCKSLIIWGKISCQQTVKEKASLSGLN